MTQKHQKLLRTIVQIVMHDLDPLEDPYDAYFVLSFCKEAIRVHFELEPEKMQEVEECASLRAKKIPVQ